MSIYDERPWLASYDADMPAELDLEPGSCLAVALREQAKQEADG